MVENGPRPPQKHQDAGLLSMPISELFPSKQIGGGVVVVEGFGVVVWGGGVVVGSGELVVVVGILLLLEGMAVGEVGVEGDAGVLLVMLLLEGIAIGDDIDDWLDGTGVPEGLGPLGELAIGVVTVLVPVRIDVSVASGKPPVINCW
jgi:hypothetical protein